MRLKNDFSGEADVEKLPQLWNKKYEEYLGISPQNDAEGIHKIPIGPLGNLDIFPHMPLALP